MPGLDVDLTDLDNFANGFPHAAFRRHRRGFPVYCHERTSHTPDGEGFWSEVVFGPSSGRFAGHSPNPHLGFGHSTHHRLGLRHLPVRVHVGTV
jgi:hypothetical protein